MIRIAVLSYGNTREKGVCVVRSPGVQQGHASGVSAVHGGDPTTSSHPQRCKQEMRAYILDTALFIT